MAKRKQIWVFVRKSNECYGSADLELLHKGRQMADAYGYTLAALHLGAGLDESAQHLIYAGADNVIVIDNPILETEEPHVFAKAAAEIISTNRPEILLIGADEFGKDFAPRLATKLSTGLTVDCTELSINKDGYLLQTKPSFGGNIMVDMITASKRPQIATVRPKVFPGAVIDATRQGSVMHESATINENDILVHETAFTAASSKTKPIESAEIVIAGGSGFKTKEDFMLLYDLAKILDAVVGATRPIVNKGWISEEYQIGQSGKTISPKCYLAFGISGAIQHRVGISRTELYIAINQDEKADIFHEADLGLVSDCVAAVKAMIGELSSTDEEKRQ